MLAEIGLIALTLSFLTSAFAVIASVYGEVRFSNRMVLSGRNAALITFPLLTIAIVALLVALINEDYQIAYVFSVSDPTTPLFYRITALWGSQKGSLLFWDFLMALFAFGAIIFNWKSDRRLMPYTIAFMMASVTFFIGITLFVENPFARIWANPVTGQTFEALLVPANAISPGDVWLAANAQGLSPLLRHFGMIIHPPMLYLGFVGFVVPFAFAMAALASGDLSTNWIKATRRWSLVAWLFLSLGLILGGRWAYDVLGWGGYWGWDPVENAAFLPWLVGTAFIHSVMIQEKRGMLKVWNMVLVIGTFSAVLFGTFATRSGVIESVHSFARSSIGFPMLMFWGAMTLIGTYLIVYRWRRGELKDEHEFAGIMSRETLFVLNNVIFMALTVTIFWGSFGAPIISELVIGQEITLGSEYFLQVTTPLFAALYILMGIAPLSAWSATSLKRLGNALVIPMFLTVVSVALLVFIMGHRSMGALFGYTIVIIGGWVVLFEIYRAAAARVRTKNENWLIAIFKLFERNQRRYGGYLVHLGIVVIGIGVIGSTLFQYETRRTLTVGDSIAIRDYVIRFDDVQIGYEVPNPGPNDREITRGILTLMNSDGQQIAMINPRIDRFPQMNMLIAGAHSTMERDFYMLMDAYVPEENIASFVIYINPLVNLVWWGGIILIIGTVAATYPKNIVPEHVRTGNKRKESA
ncbi:MAG: cytochrome c-type biogenesis CcmF C-terminal domain-containing protein [Phototrophicaceae bacterium]